MMKRKEFERRSEALRQKHERIEAAIGSWSEHFQGEHKRDYEDELSRLQCLLDASTIKKLQDAISTAPVHDDAIQAAKLKSIGTIENDSTLNAGEQLMQIIFTILRSNRRPGQPCPLCQRD